MPMRRRKNPQHVECKMAMEWVPRRPKGAKTQRFEPFHLDMAACDTHFVLLCAVFLQQGTGYTAFLQVTMAAAQAAEDLYLGVRSRYRT